MTAREQVLARIRKSQGGPANQRIPREYAEASPLSREEVVEQFADRLRDYNATVHRCAATAIAETVAGILQARGKTGLLVPAGVPAAWLPAGFAFRVDEGLSYADLDASPGVLTACDAAIALTGTIVIAHTPAQGRRAAARARRRAASDGAEHYTGSLRRAVRGDRTPEIASAAAAAQSAGP